MEANHVYVIPPNCSIIMTDTHLDTQEFDEPRGRRMPIDHFFRSMAASGHQDPIAVILSGGGTDGAEGVKDVKEVGGLIMVQNPDDAEYDSMPRAAVSTGLADVVLPANQLASKLVEYIQHRPRLPHDPGQLTEPEMETLQRIIAQVHARTGHDFSQHKRSTILRRVERRMQLNGFITLEAYLTYLRGNANEAQAMFNFSVVDKAQRIYQAKAWVGERPHVPTMPMVLQNRRRPQAPDLNRPQPARFLEEPILAEERHIRALETYGPPSVIVNERYVIQHVSATAGRYLHLPKGPITGDLLILVHPELQLELRTALFHAFDKGRATASRPVAVQFNGHKRRVVVAVRPRPDEAGTDKFSERQALVVFIEDEVEDPDEVIEGTSVPHTPAERDGMVSQLQAEIQRLREQLQITIEEYESSNEEMKAANEELQSVNEELQTVNTEMRNKLDEVSQAHRELENLMGATEIATLYLDRDLCIQRFTAGVQDIFNILGVDRGRRISDLTHKMDYNQFMDDAEQVLRKLIPVEHELMRVDGKWFLMRLRPYRTVEDHIEGVVINFIDISELKETEQELVRAKASREERVKERTGEPDEANYKLTQARDLFQALFNANPIPAALTRLQDDVILDVNIQFLNYFHLLQRERVLGRSAGDLNLLLNSAGQDHDEFISMVKRDGRVRDFEYELLHPSGERRNILASVQYLKVDSTDTLISTFIDITERVRAERQIRSLASDLTVAEQEERKRISQILHDDLQQRIFAVKVQLSTFHDALQRGDSQSSQLGISRLQSLLDQSIAITRNLSIDLSPAILQGDSLVDALNWLSNQMCDQYGLSIQVDSNGVSTRFEDTLRILLFQAVREALFNVVKHAGTLNAAVSFENADGLIRLTISDEGAGFEAGATSNGEGGLLNIRHRLSLMGCQMQITSNPGRGTRVMIDIPNQQVKKDHDFHIGN
jgi:two-component system, chemotaxis family, CheB/CheR fusion protein